MALYRSRGDRIFGGVCGGMAKALGWSGFRVRLIYVIISILSAAFPGVIAYIILMFLMPPPEQVTA